jgi:DNA-binding response OmpR family regulator
MDNNVLSEEGPDMTEINSRVHVLVVSPAEADHAALARILGHSAWEFGTAQTVEEAVSFLLHHPVQVVLCDRALPDGDWKDMLAAIAGLADPPQLIVTSRDADDRLWAEVLNIGAYDVLVKPFHPKEVFRTIGLAWRHWMACRKVQTQPVPKHGAATAAHSDTKLVAAGAR